MAEPVWSATARIETHNAGTADSWGDTPPNFLWPIRHPPWVFHASRLTRGHAKKTGEDPLQAPALWCCSRRGLNFLYPLCRSCRVKNDIRDGHPAAAFTGVHWAPDAIEYRPFNARMANIRVPATCKHIKRAAYNMVINDDDGSFLRENEFASTIDRHSRFKGCVMLGAYRNSTCRMCLTSWR